MSSHFTSENLPSKENNLNVVGTPSPRKKRNNSTPTRKNAAEKRQILQQLVSPNMNSKVNELYLSRFCLFELQSSNDLFSRPQVSIGELIQLSENINSRPDASHGSDGNLRETAFTERPGSSSSAPLRTLTRQVSSDSKLEKKVTFARLLSKMSAEINGVSNIDVRD